MTEMTDITVSQLISRPHGILLTSLFPVNSIQFYSIQFNSILFNSI